MAIDAFLSVTGESATPYRVYGLTSQQFSINGDYNFLISCHVPDVDVDNWLGQSACLFLAAHTQPVYIHGLITKIDYPDTLKLPASVVCQLNSPLLCLKGEVKNSVWLNKSYPQVLLALLKSYPGMRFQLVLRENYPAQAMILQQQQNDWDFFQLILQRQGWLFALQQRQQDWQLIVVEHSAQFKQFFPLNALRYHANHNAVRSEYRVALMHACLKVLPANVNVYDYQAQRSDLVRLYSGELSSTPGYGQQYFYGLGLSDERQAKRFLDCYQAAVVSDAEQFYLVADGLPLVAGQSITLQGHPLASLNGVFCVLQVLYQYASAAGLSRVRLHLARVAYQPLCTGYFASPGYQSATIDGLTMQAADLTAAGEYHIRYPKVQSAAGSPYVSCAAPLNSLNTGFGFGWHYPLLKNTKIIYANLNNNNHYPIIIGAVASQALIKVQQASQHVLKSFSGHRLIFNEKPKCAQITLATGDGNNTLAMQVGVSQPSLSLFSAGTFYGLGQQGINMTCRGRYQQEIGDKCLWQVKNNYHGVVTYGNMVIDSQQAIRFYAQKNINVMARQLCCDAQYVHMSNSAALNIELQAGSACFNAEEIIGIKAQQLTWNAKQAMVFQCPGARLELTADGRVFLRAATINVFGQQTQIAGYKPKL